MGMGKSAYSAEELQFMQGLIDANKFYSEVAADFATKYGRKITKNCIVGLISRNHLFSPANVERKTITYIDRKTTKERRAKIQRMVTEENLSTAEIAELLGMTRA